MPISRQVEAAKRIGARGLRGAYRPVCARLPRQGARRRKPGGGRASSKKIRKAGEAIRALGMRFNAGPCAELLQRASRWRALPGVRELHIGHAIVSRALFVGMREAVREMKRLMSEAAHAPRGPRDDLRRRHRPHRDHAHRARCSSASASASRGASCAEPRTGALPRATGSRPPTSPSASPPRRPSPRRSAPASTRRSTGTGLGGAT